MLITFCKKNIKWTDFYFKIFGIYNLFRFISQPVREVDTCILHQNVENFSVFVVRRFENDNSKLL